MKLGFAVSKEELNRGDYGDLCVGIMGTIEKVAESKSKDVIEFSPFVSTIDQGDTVAFVINLNRKAYIVPK